jgi:hypothetical protein
MNGIQALIELGDGVILDPGDDLAAVVWDSEEQEQHAEAVAAWRLVRGILKAVQQ